MKEIRIDTIRDNLARYESRRADTDGRIQAAVALILVPGGEGPELLLIKRTERDDDPWSGQMAMPGGRRDREDHDLLQTAIRETREETAVELEGAEVVGELDDLSPSSPHLPPIMVRPFVFILPSRPAVSISDEVALHLWVPLVRLPASRALEEIVIRDFRITASGYRLGPHFVWGMTERIVTPFLGMVSRE
ncbi:NUDIX hydrolase [Gemmatimonadota bacterium]